MKGFNKDALQSGRDRYTAKNYITTWIFPLYPFPLMLLMDFYKSMYNYHFINCEIRPE